MDETRGPSHDEHDEPFDPILRAAAAAYHEPPATVPRDAMWNAIQQARRAGHASVDLVAEPSEPRVGLRPAWTWRRWPTPMLAAAASVLIALGISLGWWVRGAARGPSAAEPADSGLASVAANEPAYRIAVTRDLTQAEALLTEYRTDARAHDTAGDVQLGQWARELLSNTRLLLDSPVGADPQRRQLLQDLELVLVQMTQSDASRTATDREMIDRTLDHDHVMPRIRAAVPAGSAGT
jgi:hypothetical protein